MWRVGPVCRRIAALVLAAALLAACAPQGQTRTLGPGVRAADPSPAPTVVEADGGTTVTPTAPGDAQEVGPGVVAAGARDAPLVTELDLGVVRGLHLTLRPAPGGAEVVDGSGTVVVGPTASRDDAPDWTGASGFVGGDAFVEVGSVPTRYADGRVFYTVLSGFGRGLHAVEVPTFRLPDDDRSWYVLVFPDLRGSGLLDTTSGVAFARADGTVGCASDDSPRACGIGDEEVAAVRRLLEHPST